MFTLHRPPTVIPAFVALLTFALSAPIAVQARDPMLAEVPVLAAEDQVPALASEGVRVNPSDDRIANALFDDLILVPMPSLIDVSATTETVRLFTVTGQGFTAGGRVYLAIYDQMGAQLYETRWITASPPLLAVTGPTGHAGATINGYGRGGSLREAFANLCGATAMRRASTRPPLLGATG